MESQTVVNGQVQPCCQIPGNLVVIEQRRVENGAVVVRQCAICKRKHYELETDPIEIRSELKGL